MAGTADGRPPSGPDPDLGSDPVGGGEPGPAGPSAEDVAALARYAAALADGVEAALPGWVAQCVAAALARAHRGFEDDARAAAAAAGRQAAIDIGPRVRALLALDVDEQPTGPLAVIRTAVRYPTDVLRAEGVAPVARDEFAVATFPDDVYDLAPASFADLDPALHEPGLVWGAAKAHVVLRRRRAEGRR
jgi:hypothetical protein